MLTLLAFVAGAALLTGDLPDDQRRAKLAPLFEPRPGMPLTLDPSELRDHARRAKDWNMRGFLGVKPPKGSCLTIEHVSGPDLGDERICKNVNLHFTLSDLDINFSASSTRRQPTVYFHGNGGEPRHLCVGSTDYALMVQRGACKNTPIFLQLRWN